MDRRIDRRTRLSGAGRWRWAGLLVAVLLLGGLEESRAQPAPQVDARVSVDSVKVGERFRLTLEVTHPGDAAVQFPSADAGSGRFGDLSIVGRGDVHTQTTEEGARVARVAYDVAAFAVDTAQVPVLPVRFIANGDTTIAGSPPRQVPIVSVVGPDADGLRKPALLASFPRTLWWWTTVALAVLAVSAAGAYVWWRRRRDEAATVGTEEETRRPHAAVVDRLRPLSRRNPNDRVSCKAFYVELTEAVRTYLAVRLGVPALECTTRELLAVLQSRPDVPDAVVPRLSAVLEQADLVKFADARPDPEESQALLKKARGVVDAIEAAQRRAESATPAEEQAPA